MKKALAAALLAVMVLAWQAGVVHRQRGNFGVYNLPSKSALSLPKEPFVPLFYYAGVFPVATPAGVHFADRAAARRYLETAGPALSMDPIEGFVWGDWGQMLMYLPGAWWRGSTDDLDVRPFQGIAFTLSLVALLLSFAACGRTGLGVLFVLFLGSSGFQLAEVHAVENVWGWTITANLFLLALFLPILLRRWTPGLRAAAAIGLTAGLALGTLSTVRIEAAESAVGVALAYFLFSKRRRTAAFLGMAVFVASFLGVRTSVEKWFEVKIVAARNLVSAAGGRAYHGPVAPRHVFWHAVFCGLGDFGQKHGYAWDDRVAQAYAAPILLSRYGLRIEPGSKVGWHPWTFPYKDDGRTYRLPPDLLPSYSVIMREKILNDIVHDPGWYVGVLVRRAARIVVQTQPIEVRMAGIHWALPLAGWLLVTAAFAAAAAFRIRWFAPVLAFTLCPSAVAFLVYSGGGAVDYSIYHFFCAAFLIWAGWRFSRARVRRASRRLAMSPSGKW